MFHIVKNMYYIFVEYKICYKIQEPGEWFPTIGAEKKKKKLIEIKLIEINFMIFFLSPLTFKKIKHYGKG